MEFLQFPELTREELAAMSSWTILRKAGELRDRAAVTAAVWESPVLCAEVADADVVYQPELNLKSLTFVRSSCACPTGRRGAVCEHALAAYLFLRREAEAQQQAPVAPAAARAQPAAAARSGGATPSSAALAAEPRSLRLDAAGAPLTVRLHFPPDEAAALERGRWVLRMEFVVQGKALAPEKLFRGTAYALDPATLAAVVRIEDWCAGACASLLQLKSLQLLELLECLQTSGEYLQARGGQPIDAAGLRERLRKTIGVAEPGASPPRTAKPAGLPAVRRAAVPGGRAAVPGGRAAVPGGRAQALAPRAAAASRGQWPDNWMVIDGSPKFLAILLRDREHPCYRGCVDWLRQRDFVKEPSNGLWWLRDMHKVLNLLAQHKDYLVRTYDPAFTDNFEERTRVLQPVEIVTATESAAGGGYQVRMELVAEGLDSNELRRAVLAGRRYIIQEERIYLLEERVIVKFNQATRSLGSDPNTLLTGLFQTRLGRAGLADAQRVLDELDTPVELPEDWVSKSTAILQVGKLEAPPLPAVVAARLRAYQLIGTAWLWHLARNELGGVLADEMGLGKTIQAISLLLCWDAAGRDLGAKVLLVVPASLIGNWRRELQAWAPRLSCHTQHGQQRNSDADSRNDADIWLTSYSTLLNDMELVQDQEWAIVIADEAQHIKNRRTQAARSLRSIPARARFVLSGTPIENSIDDLRSLFEFCLPGYLGRVPPDTRGEERSWFERRHLEKAAPYILRRSKRLVAPELPEKIEQTLWCPMSPAQAELYRAVQRKSEQVLMELAASGASENRVRFTLLTELLRLRQVCADPGMIDADFPLEQSSKYLAFMELLEESIDGGHRLLVFSQFVKLLQRLKLALDAENVGYCYIDGSTRDRLAVCDRFNNDPSIPVCLISLKAGGTGLNLTGADTVVHFDPWWNPAVEDQATDRAHRIGQRFTVTSYKLVAESSVEEKVLALQAKKAELLRDLLDESAHQSAKVDLLTLQSLIQQC